MEDSGANDGDGYKDEDVPSEEDFRMLRLES